MLCITLIEFKYFVKGEHFLNFTCVMQKIGVGLFPAPTSVSQWKDAPRRTNLRKSMEINKLLKKFGVDVPLRQGIICLGGLTYYCDLSNKSLLTFIVVVGSWRFRSTYLVCITLMFGPS